MPYVSNSLKTEAFIAGKTKLYNLVRENPQLTMVPIDQQMQVCKDLNDLGYKFRIRYRGPHGPRGDTIKANARAFTVYIIE